MDWKYFIPHIWEHERPVWEDVYLLPVDSSYNGQALWLTIDALGNVNKPEHGSDRAEFQVEALQKLGDQSYYIDDSNILIRAEDFTKQEMLEWVRVWIQENGLPITNLLEGSRAEFSGRALHTNLLNELLGNELE